MKNLRLKPKTYNLKASMGFVLLFSLLVSSILLATGLGISRIMVRQITLASLSRESQVAFFAADSGLECAMHWNVFGKFDPVPVAISPNPFVPRTIYCNGAIIEGDRQSVPPGLAQVRSVLNCDIGEPPSTNMIRGDQKSCFTFSIPLTSNASACAFVVVDKSNVVSGYTTITSNGYNSCNLTAANLLQRTLETTLVICQPDSTDPICLK